MRNSCKVNGIDSGIANIYVYIQMCNLGLSTLSYPWPVFKKKKKKEENPQITFKIAEWFIKKKHCQIFEVLKGLK